MERLGQLNNITIQRVNDPTRVNEGDPNKIGCYETIESTTFCKEEDFIVKPMKSYDIEDTMFNQLEFSVNHSLFVFAQF